MDKKAENNTTIRIAFLVAIFYTVSFSDDSLFDDVYVDSTLHIRNGVVVNNGTAKLKGADTVTSTNYVYVLKESDTSIAIIPVDSIGGGGSVDSVRAAYISDTVKNIPGHGHGIDSVYNLQDSLNAKISGSLSTNRLVKATSSNTVGSASITQYAYYDPVYIWAETENIGGGKYTLGLNEAGTEGEGVGPGIVFSAISAVAGIFGVKANGTAGDYSGLFGIQTKQNSLGKLVTRWLVDSLGRMSNDTLVHDSSFHAGSGIFTGGLRAEGSTLLMGCDTVVSSSYLYTLNSTDTSVSLISIDTVLKDVVDDLNSKQDTLYRESGVNNGIVYMNDDWGAYNLYAANWMTYDDAFGDVDYSGNMFNLEYGTNKGILSFSSNVNTRVWGLQNDSGKVYVKYTDTAGAGYPNPWTIDTTLMVIKKDTLVLYGTIKISSGENGIVLDSSAVVWEDLNFDVVRSGGPVANRPDDVIINNVYYMEFTNLNNQTCGSTSEIPHSAKLNSPFYPHIHGFLKAGESSGTTGITFRLYYDLRTETDTTYGYFDFSKTSAQISANPYLIDFYGSGSDTIIGIDALDAQVSLRIDRTSGDAGDFIITTYGLHYAKDMIGSATMETK